MHQLDLPLWMGLCCRRSVLCNCLENHLSASLGTRALVDASSASTACVGGSLGQGSVNLRALVCQSVVLASSLVGGGVGLLGCWLLAVWIHQELVRNLKLFAFARSCGFASCVWLLHCLGGGGGATRLRIWGSLVLRTHTVLQTTLTLGGALRRTHLQEG